MADIIPNDLSHMSDEDFNALCPQGHHAPGPEPLSPAAQAVLTAQAKQRCLFEWSTVNDPPCHPSDPEWNGCGTCVDRRGLAAALCAAADQLKFADDYGTRLINADDLLAIAIELENHQ